jgi:hypothetical protein
MLAALVLAVSSNAPPERDLLLARWRSASSASLPANRRMHEGPTAVTPVNLLRALADYELKRPGRYTLTVTAPPVESNPPWWDRLWRWIGDRWSELWKAVFGRLHLGRAAVTSVGDATIAAIALLLVLMVLKLAELRLKPASRARSVHAHARSPSARELDGRANALAREGAYAAAARLLFSAMLAALEERGVLCDDRSSTVGDVRRHLSGREPGLVAGFNGVAAAFVTATYAERPVERREWEHARAAYRSIVSETAA